MYDFTRLNQKYVVKYDMYIKKRGKYMQFINIGYGNIISANKIISIIVPGAAPIKRLIQEARDKSLLVDATSGRKTRAVIVMETGHIILSAVQPETVVSRLNKDITEKEEE